MSWKRLQQVPHVIYASTQTPYTLMLHFGCDRCGDRTNWRCEGAPGMPLYRLYTYANQHLHGYPPIPNPRPRG